MSFRLSLLFGALFVGSSVATAQDAFIPVPQNVVGRIGGLLPESSNAGAPFNSQAYSPNLVLTEPANVSVTFIWEGAGFRNTLGYFTYQEEPDGSVTILSSNLVMPDASFPNEGTAATGDTYDLRDAAGNVRVFQPGERIGFFVVANGWIEEPLIQNWDASAVAIPSNDPELNSGFGRGCYTTIDKLNQEYAQGSASVARHAAMILMPGEPGFLGGEPFIVTGFEDLLRTSNSDNDFNDLMFIIKSSPFSAVAKTPVLVYEFGDPDGDGIFGANDHYPNDPKRAFVTRYPANGEETMGMEDQYPGLGDADYNDVVMAYHFELVTGASGRVMDIQLTAHLAARGAGYDHSIGLHLPGIPDQATGTVDLQRFLSDDALTIETEATRSVADLIAIDDRRVDDLIVSTRAALPPALFQTFTNTQSTVIERAAASVRLLISFDKGISQGVLGPPPYDPYISVLKGVEKWDVHLPGKSGFYDRPANLPEETGSESFLDDLGRPWLFVIPTSWRFPKEQTRIWNAYPDFNAWATGDGTQFSKWYENPSTEPDLLGFDLNQYIPVRNWSVTLPTP